MGLCISKLLLLSSRATVILTRSPFSIVIVYKPFRVVQNASFGGGENLILPFRSLFPSRPSNSSIKTISPSVVKFLHRLKVVSVGSRRPSLTVTSGHVRHGSAERPRLT